MDVHTNTTGETMNEEVSERLSALMDGELARAHEVRAIEAALADQAARATWNRYHLIGAAMRDEAHAAGGELAARVRAALEREPAALVTEPATRRAGVPRLQRRLAIAASLTLAVLAAGWMLQGDAPVEAIANASTEVPVNPAPTALASAPGDVASPSSATSPAPEALAGRTPAQLDLASAARDRSRRVGWSGDFGAANPRRLSSYLVSHNERGSMTGMHPYARIVGYQASVR